MVFNLKKKTKILNQKQIFSKFKMEKKKIKLMLEDLIADSTVHGIPRLVQSHSLLAKLIWIFCFIFSACYCVYMIFSTVDNYLDYGTVVDINYLTEKSVTFPAITICNQNQFQTNSSFALVENFTRNSNIKKGMENIILIDLLISENETFKKSLTHSFEETLISCRFKNSNCSVSDFQWAFIPLQGSCYRFNYDPNKPEKVSIQGKIDGFHVELYVGDPNSVANFLPTTGFHVFIGTCNFYLIYN